jgi:hypothetical protein
MAGLCRLQRRSRFGVPCQDDVDGNDDGGREISEGEKRIRKSFRQETMKNCLSHGSILYASPADMMAVFCHKSLAYCTGIDLDKLFSSSGWVLRDVNDLTLQDFNTEILKLCCVEDFCGRNFFRNN